MVPIDHTGGSAGSLPSDLTSPSLLQRVKAWDEKGWQRLVDLYGPLIYTWCRRSSLSPEDSRDVLQEIFSSVATSIGDFRGGQHRGSFRAWLRGVTQHKIQDHFRRGYGLPQAAGGTAAQEELLQVPDPPGPSIDADPPDMDDVFWRRALELVRVEFEDQTWQAFWWVAVDGRSPAEVAGELGMTVHAVYKAKSRVLRRVRQELSDLEGCG